MLKDIIQLIQKSQPCPVLDRFMPCERLFRAKPICSPLTNNGSSFASANCINLTLLSNFSSSMVCMLVNLYRSFVGKKGFRLNSIFMHLDILRFRTSIEVCVTVFRNGNEYVRCDFTNALYSIILSLKLIHFRSSIMVDVKYVIFFTYMQNMRF